MYFDQVTTDRDLNVSIPIISFFLPPLHPGDLDPPTMAMLNKPRCGVRDVTDAERDAAFEEPVSRRRRFAVTGQSGYNLIKGRGRGWGCQMAEKQEYLW